MSVIRQSHGEFHNIDTFHSVCVSFWQMRQKGKSQVGSEMIREELTHTHGLKHINQLNFNIFSTCCKDPAALR